MYYAASELAIVVETNSLEVITGMLALVTDV